MSYLIKGIDESIMLALDTFKTLWEEIRDQGVQIMSDQVISFSIIPTNKQS